jgi:hypothetical protein
MSWTRARCGGYLKAEVGRGQKDGHECLGCDLKSEGWSVFAYFVGLIFPFSGDFSRF